MRRGRPIRIRGAARGPCPDGDIAPAAELGRLAPGMFGERNKMKRCRIAAAMASGFKLEKGA